MKLRAASRPTRRCGTFRSSPSRPTRLSGDEAKDACCGMRWLRCQAIQSARTARQKFANSFLEGMRPCTIRLSFLRSTIRRRISKSLRLRLEANGYEVVTAADGEEGLAIARSP